MKQFIYHLYKWMSYMEHCGVGLTCLVMLGCQNDPKRERSITRSLFRASPKYTQICVVSQLENVHKSSTSPFIHDSTKLIQVHVGYEILLLIVRWVYQTPYKLKSHGRLPFNISQQNLGTSRQIAAEHFQPPFPTHPSENPGGGQTNLRLSSACSCCCASGESTEREGDTRVGLPKK